MANRKKAGTGVALAVSVALAASGCGGGGASGGGASGGPSSPVSAGGTLYMLNVGPVQTWDPQRNYTDTDLSVASRLFGRTLTTFPSGKTVQERNKIAADLATDTGKVADGGKTWTFTIRDGAKWQDGKAVTCQDFQYGISRTFATDQITGGQTYALTYLNIPKNAKGQSDYLGPYKKTGQALFDKAVVCAGPNITFHLNRPVFDFNQVVSLSAFGPFRKDQDTGAKGTYDIFSDGPYMLQGKWATNKGATFVRNPHWTASSDPIRKAYPDSIVYQEGMDESTAVQRIMSDSGNDKYAVTQVPASPALQSQIVSNPQIKSRMTNPSVPQVDYLAPNFKSKIMSNAKARQAFAMSTNRGAYIAASGGKSVMEPTFSVIGKNLPAYNDTNPFGTPSNGDPAAAKKVLESSGLTLPVPITVTYYKNPTRDKAFSSLTQSWEAAGFKVTLDGISQNYWGAIASPTIVTKSDVFWINWGAAWASGSTVIPELFDSRLNLSSAGSRNDNGLFDDAEVNAQMDKVSRIADEGAREKAWGELALTIAKKGGYVALANKNEMYVHGSGVKNYLDGQTGRVDLAEIAVR